jgi:GTP-dependent dephospho-CoA kinase
MIVYVVTSELMEKFKQPFGLLLRGTFSETMTKLKEIVNTEKPPMVITVGDIVSGNVHKYEINARLSITDNKSMRKRNQPVVLEPRKTLHVKNPQGTITEEAIVTVKEALQSEDHIHILVDGEEDLLALIAVLYAPDGAIVVYGQPHEGLVVVKVTEEKRAEAQKLLDSMKCKKS